jgi:hypothetical protein
MLMEKELELLLVLELGFLKDMVLDPWLVLE